MRSKHVYASVDLFKDYLAGDSYSADWGDDETVIRHILESASLTIEAYVGDRSFSPYTATREYDLGKGALRSRSEMPRDRHVVLATDPVLGVVPLGDWLTAVPTTVTAYDSSARDSSTVLTEGLANDYILQPYPQAPYHTLKLTENTANILSQGQKTLTVLGAWGWQNETVNGDSLNDAVSSTATTVVKTDASADIYPGNTILIDSEQMYVRAKNGTHLTVLRGVNGTTAATHSDGSGIDVFIHPSDVVEACLAIARDRWRSREAGTTAVIGSAGATITRPGAEVRAILRGLDNYKQTRDNAGVYF